MSQEVHSLDSCGPQWREGWLEFKSTHSDPLLSRRLNPREWIKPQQDAHNVISFRYLRGGAEKMTIPVLNSAGHIPLAQNSNRVRGTATDYREPLEPSLAGASPTG